MFLEEVNLKNCPERFALNCKRYEIQCHNCRANETGKYLKYLPINKSIVPHPVGIKQKTHKVSYSRAGRTVEKKLINKSPRLNSTYASGSVAGNGDATLSVGDEVIRMEIKTRFKNYESRYTPTSAELKEGQTQGIKIWYIVNKDSSKVTAYIEAKWLNSILRYITMYCPNYVPFDSEGGGHLFKFRSASVWFILDAVKLNRGTKPSNNILNQMNFVYLYTKYGQYVMCELSVLHDLLHVYESLIKSKIKEDIDCGN